MLKDKILVADDEQSMREFLDIMLKKEGYKVSLASNGEEVLRLAERDIFDLVLMDIRMPHMDGLEATRHIMSVRPTPIAAEVAELYAHFWHRAPVRMAMLTPSFSGPSRITSVLPPTEVATVGVPQDMASSNTVGNPS
jgi:CheY-like chemotaxis protein